MNGDLISREALKKAIMYKTGVAEETWEQLYDSVLEEIDNAPTVEPRIEYGTDGQPYRLFMSNGNEYERPQGKWIIHNSFDGWVECPFCHVGRTVFEKLPKFCENCGADMKGGAE